MSQSAAELMEPEFAQFRLWAAQLRDRLPAGSEPQRKAAQLCTAMDAWHFAWLKQREGGGATNLAKPLESVIERLVLYLYKSGHSNSAPTKMSIDTVVELPPKP